MRKYLFCEAGFIEKPNWLPNCWVNVECPTPDDFDFLEKELNVPAAFLHDIADTEDRKSTRLNSSHTQKSRMPSSD